MKIYIVGMSMARGNLRAWIEAHTRQTIIALAQLYLFPYGNRVHWRKEVWSKFSEMHRLKPSNKLPSAQFIFDNSYNVYINSLNDLLQYVIDKEHEYDPISGWNEDNFRIVVEDYFLWLSDMLSRKDWISMEDCYSRLDRLGLTEKYI